MRIVSNFWQPWTRGVRWLALPALLALTATTGCAEAPVEESAVDVEKNRQEHIQMMQRETGQAPAGEAPAAE